MGFFKAYDMRGTYGVDFDLALVRKVGRALPQVVKGTRWLVGRDCRVTSDAVAEALVAGLAEADVSVDDLGRVTTPMVYRFTAADGYDGSVMVTASHNPPTDNGLKVSMRTSLPVGYANGLAEVERLVAADTNEAATTPSSSQKVTRLDPETVRARYLAWMREHAAASLDGLRFAVDCSNGMSSILAHDLFPGAVFLNDVPDGNFPCHSPNPLLAEAREQIASCVRANGLDAGVIFDGDADRAMFVDENGDFVQPDYLIPIVARATAAASGGNGSRIVIHDVRTSRGAIEALRADGFEPAMVPVGHAFAKPRLRELGALCGGELAGHYYFAEFDGCDSGVLAALRILNEIAAAKRRGESFSAMMRPIVTRYANSGELNFRVADKDGAIARLLAVAAGFGRERARSTMDGVRLEFPEGWVNIRKSNTEPYLRLLIECDTPARLATWRTALEGVLAAKH